MKDSTHRKRNARWLKKLSDARFMGVLDDLEAFTGIDKLRLCRLVDDSGPRVRAELRFVRPKGPVEVELFYRACREYLFLNSAREVWPVMTGLWPDGVPFGTSPVLDFGGGCGNDTLWLAEKGARVVFHEIGSVQREFVEFRLKRRGLDGMVRVASMYYGGKYDPLADLKDRGYGAVLLRDVIEHVPGYQALLAALSEKLRPKAVAFIHAPWNTEERYNPLHHEEAVPLAGVMNGLGFKQADDKGKVWRRNG